MSRRLYRSMAQGRAVLNRCEGTELSAQQIADLKAESEARMVRERARQAEYLRRVIHPVIERTGKPFRVARLFRREGHLCFEDIGEALTVEVATMIMKRERWRAQVFCGLDVVRADNFAEMERR